MENRHAWVVRYLVNILLTTINAKWIHPSLALRLLKANLGPLEENCEILEFNLRQPLAEKIEAILAARPRILGISVSIWNHTATVELLRELEKAWTAQTGAAADKPIVVLGGPEISHLPPEVEIFRYADYVIRGEGETAFRLLCENILAASQEAESRKPQKKPQFIDAEPVKLEQIKSAYHLYTDVDLTKKLIYVEASRGCPFNCEFCLSAVKPAGIVREFPLEPFLAEMDALVLRGAKTFKFLDRTFNLNIKRAIRIIEFFLAKIEEQSEAFVVHFEMVPSLFPDELRKILARFPPGALRLEIGIQTLNAEVSARISRPTDPEKELEETLVPTLRLLRKETNAIIHADLIAGLPGENLESFGRGFDRLWLALSETDKPPLAQPNTEIQLGILKLLPGAPIIRHSETFGMRYSPQPPYEVLETSAMTANDIRRIKNFARFWELLVNRGLIKCEGTKPIFKNFMTLSDSLFARFGRNWGIDKHELREAAESYLENQE